MSLIANRLRVDDSDTNGTDTNKAKVGVAANGGPIIDFFVFLPKSESNN